MLELLLQLGSMPTPPPAESSVYNVIAYGVPAFITGAALMCMAMSLCYQYSTKFRAWLSVSTCLFCTDPACPGESTCYKHAHIGRVDD